MFSFLTTKAAHDAPAPHQRPGAPAPAAEEPQSPLHVSGAGRPFASMSDGVDARPAATAEGLRDAVKRGDAAALRSLLAAGVPPGGTDTTGHTLLHVACLFDRGECAAVLLEAGADAGVRNAAGETPLDVAPPALAARLRARAAELAAAAAAAHAAGAA